MIYALILAFFLIFITSVVLHNMILGLQKKLNEVIEALNYQNQTLAHLNEIAKAHGEALSMDTKLFKSNGERLNHATTERTALFESVSDLLDVVKYNHSLIRSITESFCYQTSFCPICKEAVTASEHLKKCKSFAQ